MKSVIFGSFFFVFLLSSCRTTTNLAEVKDDASDLRPHSSEEIFKAIGKRIDLKIQSR